MKLQTKNRGLGNTSEILDIERVIRTAILIGFLPQSFSFFSENNPNSYHYSTWTTAYKNGGNFIYPSKIGLLPNENCASTLICTLINQINNLFSRVGGGLGLQEFDNVYNGIVATILYIIANELEGDEKEAAEKTFYNLIISIPSDLQNRIVMPKAAPEPKKIFLESPARPEGDGLQNILSPKDYEQYTRGTEPNERTNEMYTTTQIETPKTPNIENYYFVGQSREPEVEKNNTALYIGIGVLIVAATLTASELLSKDKKKKKR